jgi:hypothetical protein
MSLLGEGSYGCVFGQGPPACGDTPPGVPVVHKYFATVEDRDLEASVAWQVAAVDPDHVFSVPVYGTCAKPVADLAAVMATPQGARCSVFTKFAGAVPRDPRRPVRVPQIDFGMGGGTVLDAIKSARGPDGRARMTSGQLVRLLGAAESVMRGLVVLQAAGVFHWDLKENNITVDVGPLDTRPVTAYLGADVVARADPEGAIGLRWRLIDWGLASAAIRTQRYYGSRTRLTVKGGAPDAFVARVARSIATDMWHEGVADTPEDVEAAVTLVDRAAVDAAVEALAWADAAGEDGPAGPGGAASEPPEDFTVGPEYVLPTSAVDAVVATVQYMLEQGMEARARRRRLLATGATPNKDTLAWRAAMFPVPPELVSRADVYAMGYTLHEVLRQVQQVAVHVEDASKLADLQHSVIMPMMEPNAFLRPDPLQALVLFLQAMQQTQYLGAGAGTSGASSPVSTPVSGPASDPGSFPVLPSMYGDDDHEDDVAAVGGVAAHRPNPFLQ